MKKEQTDFALQTLIYARERETLLINTELQNSKEPEVYAYAKNIEQLGAAIDLLEARDKLAEALIGQARETMNNYYSPRPPLRTDDFRTEKDFLTDQSRTALIQTGHLKEEE